MFHRLTTLSLAGVVIIVVGALPITADARGGGRGGGGFSRGGGGGGGFGGGGERSAPTSMHSFGSSGETAGGAHYGTTAGGAHYATNGNGGGAVAKNGSYASGNTSGARNSGSYGTTANGTHYATGQNGAVAANNGHYASTSYNGYHNTTINNVNVDNGWNAGGYYGYHPAAAVAATAVVAAAVVGSAVSTLPPGCVPYTYSTAYYNCGGGWYQPQYQGSNVTYVVVNPPAH